MLQQTVTPVQSAGDALRVSLATFAAAIPRVLGFVLILVVGWFIASLIGKGVAALLRAVKFNELARRSGFAEFVHKMGVRTDSSGVIASVATWFVRLITLVVAFDQLGLPAVSDTLNQLLLWLPNLVVALVVLVVGGLAATALGNLVRGATAGAGFTNANTLAAVAKAAVWAFAIVVAINQLGIATTLINTLLVGVVGALALATGLAFGLGGRDKAAELLDRWGRRAEAAGPGIRAAAGKAQRQAGAQGAMATGAVPRGEVGSMPAGAGASLDAGWVQRTGFDRRRVDREGRDRRAAANGGG